ncbi:MAG: phosphoribosylanthranilate isomerase [Chloroflexi bacterium]|nr:phosphoribosylanthranilate isomerase [Chloroflexota bacterium]
MTQARTKVKICGIRTLDDARVAADAGADFIGLVFVPGRHRRLEPDAAAAIVSGLKNSGDNGPQIVGSFADQPLEEVNQTIEGCGLDVAQLCGKESLDYCSQTRAQVIKVVHIPDSSSDRSPIEALAERIRTYRTAGNLVTLDRLVEGLQGGTGERFDWSIATELATQGYSFLLAGGLDPENVAQAVASVRPWGVDVSSGVETGGVKDHAKIRAFIHNARQP